MPLPDIIEIVPLEKPVRAEITVPGSKSITNRALILAALAEGEVTLEGALWSEDTQIMVECLQELGFMVDVRPDPNEFSNRTITVYGKGGDIPPGGTEQQPVELFVGNAGTAARFLAAFVCLGKGVYKLHGVPRMNERPKAALFKALRELGYRVESPTDKLPAIIYGSGPKPGAKCTVNIEESSQFASALLLCAKVGGWNVEVVGENAEESPYVKMTSALCGMFPLTNKRFNFIIEPDASSGSYFWATGWLFSDSIHPNQKFSHVSPIRVCHWPISGWQIDAEFPNFLPLPDAISRQDQLGDSIMTAIILAPFAQHTVRFENLTRLRHQECERVMALQKELSRCGAKAIDHGATIGTKDFTLVTPDGEPIETGQVDTLEIFSSKLHGAEIETYNDHRMAMCFAILGLKVPGIKLKNPACVKKTFPNFFQKLAAAPPHGLGATILDATGRKLAHDELFAD